MKKSNSSFNPAHALFVAVLAVAIFGVAYTMGQNEGKEQVTYTQKFDSDQVAKKAPTSKKLTTQSFEVERQLEWTAPVLTGLQETTNYIQEALQNTDVELPAEVVTNLQNAATELTTQLQNTQVVLPPETMEQIVDKLNVLERVCGEAKEVTEAEFRRWWEREQQLHQPRDEEPVRFEPADDVYQFEPAEDQQEQLEQQ